MLLAGASAVAVGTANFRDPRAPYRVLDELVDWCARHDVARVSDLIGALEELMTTADPRDHLVLVLDVDDLDAALAIARARVSRGSASPRSGSSSTARPVPRPSKPCRTRVSGCSPTSSCTTSRTRSSRAARVLGRHGVDFLNFHAAGGEAMLRAGRRRSRAKARATRGTRNRSRSRSPCSRATRTSTRSTRACDVARDAGCDGVVCAGTDVDVARGYGLAHDGARHPAPGWRRRTTRRASTHPVTRSRVVPTGS